MTVLKCDICGKEIERGKNNDKFNFAFADMFFELKVGVRDDCGASRYVARICKSCNAKFTKAVAKALDKAYNKEVAWNSL